MDEQQKIDAYIRQMMEIKARKEQEQIKSDLREISMELGMSEEDLQAIEEERKKLVILGRGFVQHQQADDAINALEKAYSLNPDDAETLSLLAQAYGVKFVQTNQQPFKKKSEEFAAQALLQNPEDQKALALLQSVRYQPKKEVQWGRVGVLGGLAAVVGFVGYSIIGGGNDKSAQTNSQNPQTEIQANNN
ncbi:MAG: tetratricopeptide repeat protein, partial [Raineya sp.]